MEQTLRITETANSSNANRAGLRFPPIVKQTVSLLTVRILSSHNGTDNAHYTSGNQTAL